MGNATVNEAVEVQKGHFDPYQLDPSHILEPPTKMRKIIKKIGPGIVLSASIVGWVEPSGCEVLQWQPVVAAPRLVDHLRSQRPLVW